MGIAVLDTQEAGHWGTPWRSAEAVEINYINDGIGDDVKSPA